MYTEHSHIHTPRLTHLEPPLCTWTRCPFRFYPPKPILWRSGTNSQRHREIRSHSPYSWIIFFHVLGRISSFVSESIYHDFRVEELRVTILFPQKWILTRFNMILGSCLTIFPVFYNHGSFILFKKK